MCKVTAGDVEGGHGGDHGEHDGGNAGSEGHAGEPVTGAPALHRLLPPNSATDLLLQVRTATPPSSPTNQPYTKTPQKQSNMGVHKTSERRSDRDRLRLRRCDAANDGGLGWRCVSVFVVVKRAEIDWFRPHC